MQVVCGNLEMEDEADEMVEDVEEAEEDDEELVEEATGMGVSELN